MNWNLSWTLRWCSWQMEKDIPQPNAIHDDVQRQFLLQCKGFFFIKPWNPPVLIICTCQELKIILQSWFSLLTHGKTYNQMLLLMISDYMHSNFLKVAKSFYSSSLEIHQFSSFAHVMNWKLSCSCGSHCWHMVKHNQMQLLMINFPKVIKFYLTNLIKSTSSHHLH